MLEKALPTVLTSVCCAVFANPEATGVLLHCQLFLVLFPIGGPCNVLWRGAIIEKHCPIVTGFAHPCKDSPLIHKIQCTALGNKIQCTALGNWLDEPLF